MDSRRGDEIDCVTMTLFSKEGADGSYNQSMFREVDNVAAIIDGLSAAAKRNNRSLTFVLYVHLIPNWDRQGNSYEDQTYLALQEIFLKQVKDEFKGFSSPLVVVDFYNDFELSDAQKQYMHMLRPGGSNLDIMKFHSVVESVGQRHLQMDTNTKVASFDNLYMGTFGLPDAGQRDGLNACLYSERYIAAHSKVIYTTESSALAARMAESLPVFFQRYQNDAAHKHPSANRLYGQFFVGALNDVGLTLRGNFALRSRPYYPANLDENVFQLTRFLVSAVLKTWAASSNSGFMDDLNKIEPIKVDDATVDFKVFEYLVKKYTAIYTEHATTQSGGQTQDDRVVRDQFLAASDTTLEYRILGLFYNHVCQNCSQDLVESLARVIPNTPRGNVLTDGLFSCSVEELHAKPVRDAAIYLTPYAPAVHGKDEFPAVPYSFYEFSMRSIEAVSGFFSRSRAGSSAAQPVEVDKKEKGKEKEQLESEVEQRGLDLSAGFFGGGASRSAGGTSGSSNSNSLDDQNEARKGKQKEGQKSQHQLFQGHDASQSQGTVAKSRSESEHRLTKTRTTKRSHHRRRK